MPLPDGAGDRGRASRSEERDGVGTARHEGGAPLLCVEGRGSEARGDPRAGARRPSGATSGRSDPRSDGRTWSGRTSVVITTYRPARRIPPAVRVTCPRAPQSTRSRTTRVGQQPPAQRQHGAARRAARAARRRRAGAPRPARPGAAGPAGARRAAAAPADPLDAGVLRAQQLAPPAPGDAPGASRGRTRSGA
jgi:hypothetical protein